MHLKKLSSAVTFIFSLSSFIVPSYRHTLSTKVSFVLNSLAGNPVGANLVTVTGISKCDRSAAPCDYY